MDAFFIILTVLVVALAARALCVHINDNIRKIMAAIDRLTAAVSTIEITLTNVQAGVLRVSIELEALKVSEPAVEAQAVKLEQFNTALVAVADQLDVLVPKTTPTVPTP